MAFFTILKSDPEERKIASFDIETYSDKNLFLFGSVWYEEKHRIFYEPEEMIDWIVKNLGGYWIFATNLEFDFFALWKNFLKKYPNTPIFKNRLLCVKVFNTETSKKRYMIKNEIKFLDTMNYVPISVESLGKIIGIEKMKKPEKLGKHFREMTEEERDYFIKYNVQDSRITYEFVKWFQKELMSFGAELDITISRIALQTFRRKFFDDLWFSPKRRINDFVREAYYGGRTEVFKRGKVSDLNYYDVNSLYPSVMLDAIPHPNTAKFIEKFEMKHLGYSGVARAEVFCPDNIFPYLPFRTKTGKLIFPTGTFSGTWTTYELNVALSLGYKILKLENGIIYTEKKEFFRDYVNTLYEKRMKFKKEKNPAELIFKLLLNSLYGKFGQRGTAEEWIHASEYTDDMFEDVKEIIADAYIRVRKDMKESTFIHPIVSAYITAYARTKLYFILIKNDPYYCDTDSLFTKNEIKTSDRLGDLKLECKIKSGIIVKPKCYFIDTDDMKKPIQAKIKGAKRLTPEGFREVLEGRPVFYEKFMKFKESVKRKMDVNEKLIVNKKFLLEDDKRVWPKKFNKNELQESKPIAYIQENASDLNDSDEVVTLE